MKTFERNIFIAFVCSAATLVVLIVFGIHVSTVRVAGDWRIRVASQQLSLMEELQRRLLEAESAQRGYAITGQGVFSDEYATAGNQVLKLLKKFQDTRFDLPDQADGAAQVVALGHARLAAMEELVAVRLRSGADAAREFVAEGRGRNLTHRIQALMLAFKASQTGVIDEINQGNASLSRQLQWLIVGFAAFNVLLMTASFFLVRREWRRGGQVVRQLQAATEEISLLNNLASSLQSCRGIAEAKDLLQHFMERLFPGQSGALYVAQSARGVLEAKAAWGDTREWEALMETTDCWALRRGQMHDFSAGGSNLPCQHVRSPEGGYVCVPMMAEGEVLGLLHLRDLAHPGEGAAAGHEELRDHAERLATQIGPAIASLTLREQLHQHSIRDGLTGLFNRRYLEETVGREILRARRSQVNVAVIMVDVDHFKQFNDTHGHQAGDAVLQAFATYLQESIRGDDIACRYGGEEFTIILPGTTPDGALERAEQLRRGTAELRLRLRGESLPSITASFGVAFFPQDGDTWNDLLRAADAALYRAKYEGRNRVVVASTVNDDAALPPAASDDVG